MENWGEAQEAIKANVNLIKEQMSQLVEALAALKSTTETHAMKNAEVTSSAPSPLIYVGKQD